MFDNLTRQVRITREQLENVNSVSNEILVQGSE